MAILREVIRYIVFIIRLSAFYERVTHAHSMDENGCAYSSEMGGTAFEETI
jgi:hypothetical protein